MHIQYGNERWVNTDLVATVSMHGSEWCELHLASGITVDAKGDWATRFLDEYKRLCVASQRPEVG